MASKDTDTDGDDNMWEEKWVQIGELEAGSHDPFPEFVEEVRRGMEHVGNEVGRPLVMKVKVQAVSGELKDKTNTERRENDE